MRACICVLGESIVSLFIWLFVLDFGIIVFDGFLFRHQSCYHSICSVSELSIRDCTFGFFNVYNFIYNNPVRPCYMWGFAFGKYFVLQQHFSKREGLGP
jgi:hypothetical protein